VEELAPEGVAALGLLLVPRASGLGPLRLRMLVVRGGGVCASGLAMSDNVEGEPGSPTLRAGGLSHSGCTVTETAVTVVGVGFFGGDGSSLGRSLMYCR
jgi:hypothetical protein